MASRRPELDLLTLYHILREVSQGRAVSDEELQTVSDNISPSGILQAFQVSNSTELIADMPEISQIESSADTDMLTFLRQLCELLSKRREMLTKQMTSIDQKIGRFLVEVIDSDAYISKLRKRLEAVLSHCPDDFSHAKSSIRGEVLIQIWRKLQEGYFVDKPIEDDHHWLSFLAILAANKVIDRKRRNSRIVTSDQLEKVPYLESPDQLQDESCEYLVRAIKKCLIETKDEIIFNNRLADRSDSETAEELGYHRGSIGRRFNAIIESIRQHLENDGF